MAQGLRGFRVDVDPVLRSSDRSILGSIIVERIITRTESGQDIFGNNFRAYSQSYRDYKQSIGADTQVDLSLTGEMLSDFGVIDHGTGFIEFGFSDELSANKAAWNQGANSNIPERLFVGIEDAEVSSLEASVLDTSPVIAAQRFLNESNAIDRIFNRLNISLPSSGNGFGT